VDDRAKRGRSKFDRAGCEARITAISIPALRIRRRFHFAMQHGGERRTL
jgi:hypothetical protein